MIFHLLIVLLSPRFAAAISCDTEFPCAVDDFYYSVSIDAIQSTIPKELAEINMTGGRSAEVTNKSEFPLYVLSESSGAGSPKFIKDKKTWYIVARLSNSGDARCVPKVSENVPDQNLTKIEWDCDVRKDYCDRVINRNVQKLPSQPFPEEWYDRGLKKIPPPLPATVSHKTTQYFYFRDAVEKISTAAELGPNEDHLKISCKDSASVVSCGTECARFTWSLPNATTWSAWQVVLPVGPDNAEKELRVVIKIPESNAADFPVREFGSAVARAVDQLSTAENPLDVPIDYLTYYFSYNLRYRLGEKLGSPAWSLEVRRK